MTTNTNIHKITFAEMKKLPPMGPYAIKNYYGHADIASFCSNGKLFAGGVFWLDQIVCSFSHKTYVAETTPGDFPSTSQVHRLAMSFAKRILAADEHSPVMFLLLTREQADVLDILGAISGNNHRPSMETTMMALREREKLLSRPISVPESLSEGFSFWEGSLRLEVTIFSPETYESIIRANESLGYGSRTLVEVVGHDGRRELFEARS